MREKLEALADEWSIAGELYRLSAKQAGNGSFYHALADIYIRHVAQLEAVLKEEEDGGDRACEG